MLDNANAQGTVDVHPPQTRPGSSAGDQTLDLARHALVDKAYFAQSWEGRSPAVDVAVMADINKRALNIHYGETFRQNRHSAGNARSYITKDGFTAMHRASAATNYAGEDWSQCVNDDNPSSRRAPAK
ncbi:hypothetical protein [Paraburkholderia humisilvae]|uniref:Uncharacterized protein n=1 Tax=Paraburkholderia humisilvae TaxID=627669 RepID=A0A6J5F696_9BURK|nr:hypothetical protein [Paraburkholderia humisilvae]CAB3774390.1 hypothetical protein LMG29542_07772 [Paraburkholderia humisilvae]